MTETKKNGQVIPVCQTAYECNTKTRGACQTTGILWGHQGHGVKRRQLLLSEKAKPLENAEQV